MILKSEQFSASSIGLKHTSHNEQFFFYDASQFKCLFPACKCAQASTSIGYLDFVSMSSSIGSVIAPMTSQNGGQDHSYVQCTHFSRLHMCKTNQIMLIEPVFSVSNIMQKEF